RFSEVAYEAIAADPVLKVLTDAPSEHEFGVFVSESSGHGWRLHPAEVVPVILRLAAQHVLAKNAPTNVIDPLVHEIEDLLARLRVLLEGRKSCAFARIAYEGVDLEEGVRLELPWGLLRRATPAERAMVQFGSKGPAAILERWFPVGLAVYEPRNAGGATTQPELAVGPDAFNPDLLTFAMTLTVGHSWSVPPRFLWRSDLTLLHPRTGFRSNFEGR